MITRSELRHACFRAKNNALSEKNKDVLKYLDGKLGVEHTFDKFSSEWDLIISRSGEIVIVKPEADIDFIKFVCQEKHFQVKYKQESTEFLPKHENVIAIVESKMLDRVMNWENYNTKWVVEFDYELKQIMTKVLRAPIQKEVTKEMIQNSKVSQDDKEFVGEKPTVLETRLMSDKEKTAFDAFLKQNYPNKE